MILLQSPQLVQETAWRWKTESNSRIALVPTMGALHEGHLSLVQLARKYADKCVASIFVNPTQFAPNEDLTRYPRPFEADREKVQAAGVDLLFAPTREQMYPEGFQTSVILSKLGRHLCGASRPGHFEGVATVCLKLFQISRADVAVFGEKDFQQLRVLEQMTSDLNLPVRIVRAPLIRDADGLALSSRNRYLDAEMRQRALCLSQGLGFWRSNAEPTLSVGRIRQDLQRKVTNAGLRLDYAEVCDERELSPYPDTATLRDIRTPRLFIAAFAGITRLIDNVSLHGDSR